MLVLPLEIKLQCTFGTIDTNSNSVVKKDGFNVDIQKLDADLFRQAFESLEKIRQEIEATANNPVTTAPKAE
jgi:hypothetical protein